MSVIFDQFPRKCTTTPVQSTGVVVHFRLFSPPPATGRGAGGVRSFLPERSSPMLKCATSLWSADLTNLAAEIQRVEPYSERFHLDVADGHYVKTLLFFPDLVKAMRKFTRRPFEVHLMTTDPLTWVESFVEAGAVSFFFFPYPGS